MRQSIAVLEDSSDRIAAMDLCLADKFPFFERRFFRTADAAIDWLAHHVTDTVCISLDHDLEPYSPSCGDPGTGRMVADALTELRPDCSVIIHSTNRIAADGMEAVLVDRGWSVERIVPYDGERWISEAWLPLVRRAIVGTAAVENSLSAGRRV